MQLCFLVCVLLLGSVAARGGNSLDPMQHQAALVMKDLYHFRFEDADKKIQEMKLTAGTHYLPHLMRSHYYWWRLISQEMDDQSSRNYLESLSLAQQASQVLLRQGQPSFTDVFHLINLYALKARLDVLNGEYVRAIRHMKQCADFLKVSLGQEAVFPDFNLTSGLYNYMTAYGSRRYPFLLVYALMYPKGDMAKGKQQLQIAARSIDPVIKTEAHYFLMKILQEIEQDYAGALTYSSWLTQQYPGNLIFLYHHITLLQKVDDTRQLHTLRNHFLRELQYNDQLTARQRLYLQSLL